MNTNTSLFNLTKTPSELAVAKMRIYSSGLKPCSPTLRCHCCKQEQSLVISMIPQNLDEDQFTNVSICPFCIKEMSRLICDFDPSKIVDVDKISRTGE